MLNQFEEYKKATKTLSDWLYTKVQTTNDLEYKRDFLNCLAQLNFTMIELQEKLTWHEGK